MSKNRFWHYLAGAIGIALLIPSVATAHTGVDGAGGFWHGLAHPIGGLDHILAMLAVGLWAAQLGGRALWIVPGAFVSAMAIGSIYGHFGLPFPNVEGGIIASDFMLGLLLILALPLPTAVGAGIAAFLAIFHGYAHGAEMPDTALGLAYGIGFIIATAALHLAGIGLGLATARYHASVQDLLFRLGGGAIVLGTVYTLIDR
jgi:urease accessory protein